jgi:23S rRNA (cytidine1920-2'-O)/16S rRNA (cytidine1409-2'-O)-methyltransferase
MRNGRKRERLDKLLVEKGIIHSREGAKALILAGKVAVEDRIVDKPGTEIEREARLQLRGEDQPYVSRGGIKLEGALNAFKINPEEMIVMDVGASTGGFTDCVLQRGAKRVYAVDVGYGQLSWKLQKDPRVVSLERKNIRYLKIEEVGEKMDLILIDTSFISIEKFLPHLLHFLREGGFIVGLIKPQFEVGKGEVGKGGVVRDSILHQKVVQRISEFSRELRLSVLGVIESNLLGPKGNKEFFIYLKKGEGRDGQGEGAQAS